MKKILVTGGAGYIGSHTSVELQEAGFSVVIVDNLSNSNIEVIDRIEQITGKRPAFYHIDCNDIDALRTIVKKEGKIDGIIHFAASKAVGESVQKPLLYYRNNIDSLLNILEIMIESHIENIVFSSSCTVYGEPDNNPIDETAPRKPATSPYGNTKQIDEDIIADVIHSGAPIKAINLRYFNPIGAHPSALIGELPIGVPQNLVPYITQTGMGIRKELTVFGDDYPTPDGSCIRDFISVVDLAKAHVAAMNRLIDNKQDDRCEIFNLGTGKGLSVLELINVFEKVSGINLPYKIGERRAGDIIKVWADPSKANNILGWKAEQDIESTMLSAWRWQQHLQEEDKK